MVVTSSAHGQNLCCCRRRRRAQPFWHRPSHERLEVTALYRDTRQHLTDRSNSVKPVVNFLPDSYKFVPTSPPVKTWKE
jgi:hypothetical protein